MIAGEKSGDGEAKKAENLGEKLGWRRKKGFCFCSTPPLSWKLYSSSPPPPPAVSARKLAAALWEFQNYRELNADRMQRSGNNNSNGRYYHHRGQRNGFRDKGVDLAHLLRDPCPSSDPDQPDSASSLRRHIAQTLMQHHRALERSNHALQPVSPASYGSSMEVAPYNPPTTPDSSLDFRGRGGGDSHYNLKTSTELLKVLNRIWSLEEQHASNVSLIKALKTELSHSRMKIKELLHDQQSSRHEMDNLMKQITEDKQGRKNKEQEIRIHAAMQSVRDELEDERKLRKRSESLHRKLARELSEAKSSLSSALRDFEKERESRKLLEEVCDEFAKAIKRYDQEVHFLKSEKDWTEKTDQDRLILHLSESWLDERMQMKIDEAQSGIEIKSSIVDKLGFEIKTFLQANSKQNNNHVVSSRERKKSLESIPEAVSASRDLCRDNESAGAATSDSNCFELNKPRNGSNKKPQVVDTEHENTGIGTISEITVSRKLENEEATPSSIRERKNEAEEVEGSSSNAAIDNLLLNHVAFSEGRTLHTENVAGIGMTSSNFPSRRNQASPVRQWMSKFASPDVDVSESATKLPPGLKENTLKSKLLEARTKAPRSRLKVFRGKS